MFVSYFYNILALGALPFVMSQTGKTSTFSYQPGGVVVNGVRLPGPEEWPGQCNDGSIQQTPINIDTSKTPRSNIVSTSDYVFNDGDCTMKDMKYDVLDNGLKATYKGGCTPPSFTIPSGFSGSCIYGPEAGKTYAAAQFHIHTKSEHLFNGNGFEAELHIVHLQAGYNVGDTPAQFGSRGASVVGFMLNGGGSSSPMFEGLLTAFETVGCGGSSESATTSTMPLKPYQFLSSNTCYFNYDGGLTTPGCNEIVEWNLADEVVVISDDQMTRLEFLVNDCPESISFQGSTSRPVQPLNGRKVTKVCPKVSGLTSTLDGLVETSLCVV